MTDSIASAKPPADTPNSRSAARLAAIQALYQMRLNEESAEAIVDQFNEYRLGREIEGDLYAEADRQLFDEIVTGVSERSVVIERHLEDCLEGRKLSRLETILQAILSAGAYELLARPDIPTAVIINEYVDLAHAFFEETQPKLVNGVLDKLARTVRG